MNFLEKLYSYKFDLFKRKKVDFYSLMEFINGLNLNKNIQLLRNVTKGKTYIFNGKEYSMHSVIGTFELINICIKKTRMDYLEKMLPLFMEGNYNMEEIYSFILSEYIPTYNEENVLDDFNLECFMDSMMFFSIMMGEDKIKLLTNMLIERRKNKILEKMLISYCNEDGVCNNIFIKMILNHFKNTTNRDAILELFTCSLLYFDQDEVLELFDKEDYSLIFDMLFDEGENNFVDDKYNEGYYVDIFQGFISDDRFEENLVVLDVEFSKSFRQTNILNIMINSLKKSSSYNAKVIAIKMLWFYLREEDKKELITSIVNSNDENYIVELTYILGLLNKTKEEYIQTPLTLRKKNAYELK